MFLCNRNNREERNQDDLLSNMIEIITDYNTKPLQGQLFLQSNNNDDYEWRSCSFYK